ncbi:MAG: hypothetical protein M1831_003904 [Alyxoria varia]|nr:MAG: hypothetical protein M1831_003904 [Alyxoria varia]
MGDSVAPPAPPLPDLPEHFTSQEASSTFAKTSSASDAHFDHDIRLNDSHDRPTAPPTGPYFLYGTLRDPSMLSGVIGLSSKPTLRPAYITGYKRKLWGPYPALVEGDPDEEVEGFVYDVHSREDAGKLASYETKNYTASPCRIRYSPRDGAMPVCGDGHVFVFVGRRRDLSEGNFDLEAWMKRMGRS